MRKRRVRAVMLPMHKTTEWKTIGVEAMRLRMFVARIDAWSAEIDLDPMALNRVIASA